MQRIKCDRLLRSTVFVLVLDFVVIGVGDEFVRGLELGRRFLKLDERFALLTNNGQLVQRIDEIESKSVIWIDVCCVVFAQH